VLVGPNGAGKTNLIEAISFSRARAWAATRPLTEVAFMEGDGSWAMASDVEGALGLLRRLGTGHRGARQRGRNRHPQSAASIASRCPPPAPFADHLRVIWLVPAMDQLFSGPAAERRRFPRSAGACGRRRARKPGRRASSARCVRAIGCWRSRAPIRIGSMPSSTRLRSLRLRLRRCGLRPSRGLSAALAVRRSSPFPSAEIALEGWMEKLLPNHSASEIEDRYRVVLRDNRARDAAAGRTLDGPHLTDLVVAYAPKDIPAADASTGEQKALLIGLVLAHAGLIAEMIGFAPVAAAR